MGSTGSTSNEDKKTLTGPIIKDRRAIQGRERARDL
jgi:hypothetical protein